MVRWHKTQWPCREKQCPLKAFTDQTAEVPAGGAGDGPAAPACRRAGRSRGCR